MVANPTSKITEIHYTKKYRSVQLEVSQNTFTAKLGNIELNIRCLYILYIYFLLTKKKRLVAVKKNIQTSYQPLKFKIFFWRLHIFVRIIFFTSVTLSQMFISIAGSYKKLKGKGDSEYECISKYMCCKY